MNREPALKPYTVTIAGHERHDGEQPWTYVVNAESDYDAVAKVAAAMAADTGWTDLKFLEIIPGVPPAASNYHWNDLREKKP